MTVWEVLFIIWLYGAIIIFGIATAVIYLAFGDDQGYDLLTDIFSDNNRKLHFLFSVAVYIIFWPIFLFLFLSGINNIKENNNNE